MARASYKIEGLEQLKEMLKGIGKVTDKAASKGLYDGAAVIADALSSAIDNITTEPFQYAPPGQTRLPSPEEVDAIREKVGVGKFKRIGTRVKASVGFAGYGDVAGRSKPAQEIARSINKGTSFMKKQPFANKAVSAAKKAARQAIVATATKEIELIIEQE